MMWEWVCGASVPLLDNRPYLNISQGTGQRDFFARIFNKLETVEIRSIVTLFIWSAPRAVLACQMCWRLHHLKHIGTSKVYSMI